MPLHVAPIVREDFNEIIKWNYKAFALGGDVFKEHIFNPYGDTPEGEALSLQYFLAEFDHDQRDHWLKAVDDATGEIVACVCWAIYETNPWETDKAVVADWLAKAGWERRKEYAETMFGTFAAAKKRMRELQRPHMYIKLLFADPKHHRRGAGSMLIKWGTQQADEKGIPCAVEASTFAHRNRVYARQGFQDVQMVTCNEENRWPELPVSKCFLMYRPAPGEEWQSPAQ